MNHFGFSVNRGVAADLADPDQDGLRNLLEFAFGLDPLESDVDRAPGWHRDGGDLVCSFVQPEQVSGITYGAEWSGSLASGAWQPVTDSGIFPDHSFEVPVPAGMSRFVRLKVVSDEGPGFVSLPAGSFLMGDQSSPLLGASDGRELPVHSVQLNAFHIEKYEVTLEEWEEVRAWAMTRGYVDLPGGNGAYVSKGAHHPVHSIHWHDAVKWCNARSQMEGLTPCYKVGGVVYQAGVFVPQCDWNADGHRLPTEAEWEMAARGGAVGKNFPWAADTISHAEANYVVFSSDGGPVNEYSYDLTIRPAGKIVYFHPAYAFDDFPFSAPVGSFPGNAYGLHDMAGNISEWCWDWYANTYYSDGSAGINPRGPVSGTHRVIRGGGWDKYAFLCRASNRYYESPERRDAGIGFRTVRTLIP